MRLGCNAQATANSKAFKATDARAARRLSPRGVSDGEGRATPLARYGEKLFHGSRAFSPR